PCPPRAPLFPYTTLFRSRARAGAPAVRRQLPAGQAARLPEQGEERPGGARGDPPGRGTLPDPGRDRTHRRRVPAVRADLDADDRDRKSTRLNSSHVKISY